MNPFTFMSAGSVFVGIGEIALSSLYADAEPYPESVLTNPL